MSISGLGGSAFAGMRGTFQPPGFSSLDSNADGSITLDELKAGAPGGASATSDARAQKLFDAMDTNGDGSVSADEKSAFDQKLAEQHRDGQAGTTFLAQQLTGFSNDDVFAATDTNGDGAVSFDEFSSDPAAASTSSDSLQKLFALIDQDGDGSISSAESSDFLDSVKSALSENGPPPPPGGGQGGGPPPPPPPDDGSSGSTSTDLLSQAQTAYQSTSQSSNLLDMLESLLSTAA